jgi:hypothetical protein
MNGGSAYRKKSETKWKRRHIHDRYVGLVAVIVQPAIRVVWLAVSEERAPSIHRFEE